MDSGKKSICIVEDDPVILRVLSERLLREGFLVIRAIDGLEGLEQALKHKPDLILLDVIMPRMNGFVTLKKLRADSWGKTARVIMLTNLGQNEDVDEAKKYGVIDYFVKSDWHINAVVKKIREVLEVES